MARTIIRALHVTKPEQAAQEAERVTAKQKQVKARKKRTAA